jgi:hypothetical protein
MAQTKHLIQYDLGDGTPIYIEAEEQGVKGRQFIGRGRDTEEPIKAESRFSEALTHIKPAAESVLQTFRDMNTPDEITLDFSLRFHAKLGAIFASADSTATFKVMLKWKNEKPVDSDTGVPLGTVDQEPVSTGNGMTNS